MDNLLSEKNKIKRQVVKFKKKILDLANKLVAAKDVPLDLCYPMQSSLNNIMNLQVIINGMEPAVDEKEILSKSYKKSKKG